MALHVRGQGGGRVVAAITDSALEWLSVIMCLQVNLEMVTSREGAGAVLTLVAFVAGMQLDMSIAASFVLEGSITVIASVDCALTMVKSMVVVVVVMEFVHLVGPNVERIHIHLLLFVRECICV